VSGFTAKRLHIIAQGFSPGSVILRGALKVAPDVSALEKIKVPRPGPNLGRHFQGDFIGRLTQG
jgi:hypothetical protein